MVAAAGLWVIAVVQARGHAVGNYGLLPLLGVSFLAASVLTIGALVLALRFVRTAWPAAVVALGLLLVEFNGTPAMLAATPLGSWAYKHFGVVDYVVGGGALRDPLDVYQQWPGFFTAAAGLVRLSGRSPLTYSNWAQLFFEALNAVTIFAIARRLSPRHRAVPYVTVLLNGRYVLHNAAQTANDPSLTGSAEFEKNGLERTDPRALAWSVANLAKGSGYLVIGPSMDRYADYYGALAPGTLSALAPRLKASPYWRVWYEYGGVVIFQARPA